MTTSAESSPEQHEVLHLPQPPVGDIVGTLGSNPKSSPHLVATPNNNNEETHIPNDAMLANLDSEMNHLK